MSIKRIISLIIAIPAVIIMASELNDASMWWIQFAAMGAVALVLAWNGAFKKGVLYER